MQSLASAKIETADIRRKYAAKLERHLPADAAAAAVLLTGPSRQNNPAAPLPAATDHESGIRVLSRTRVFLPLVEPNVLAWMRGLAVMMGTAPRPRVTDEGILAATWDSPAAHTAATRKMYEWYQAHHDAVRRIAAANMSIDSWHHPMLLVPVRHAYTDGAPSRLAWMAADGTARLFGARLALATAIKQWAPDHPWADPARHWPNDTVTLRSLAAAARKHLHDQGIDPATDWSLAYPWVEDWADLALPDPEIEQKTTRWAFREHSGNRAADPDWFGPEVADYVESLDVFSGRDPFDLLGADPATPDGRAEVADRETEVRDWLLTPTRSHDERAKKIALMATAVTDPQTTPGENARDLFAAYVNALTSYQPGTSPVLQRWHTDGLLDALLGALGTPRLGDLLGVYQDLTGGYLNDPLLDRTSPWFWITAAQGLAMALLAGHLVLDPNNTEAFATVAEGLFAGTTGTGILVGYATAVQDGTVPDDRFAPEAVEALVEDIVDRRIRNA